MTPIITPLMTSVTSITNIYCKISVYGCMGVRMFWKLKKVFSYISNQKMYIFSFLLYEYRLAYGPLKPKKWLGVWTCMGLWKLQRVFSYISNQKWTFLAFCYINIGWCMDLWNLKSGLVYERWCMDVYGPLKAERAFSYISNQKNEHF